MEMAEMDMKAVLKRCVKWQESKARNLEPEEYSELLGNEKIKKFINDSKKCQTLFANCEGSYNRRISDINDKTNLKQFIYCTLFYNEDFYYMETDDNKSLIVHEVVEKMINISKQFATPNKIHYSIIWVYYYEYASGETKWTPLFKTYKTTNTEEAVFFDIFLNIYDSWECYLKNTVLSKAFLCVPRNGRYNFVTEEKVLDLIYIVKKEQEETFKYTGPLILPFCERVVRKLLSTFKLCLEHIKNNIKILISTLSEVWEDKEKLKACLIFLLSIGLETYLSQSCNPNSLTNKVLNYGLMFLQNNFSPKQLSVLYPPTPNDNFSFKFDSSAQSVKTDNGKGLVAISGSFFDDLFSSKYTEVVKAVWCTTNIIIKAIRSSKAGLQITEIEDKIVPNLQMSTNTGISPNSIMLNNGSSNQEDKVKVLAIQLMLTKLEEIEEKPFETIRESVYEEAKSVECSEIIPRFLPLSTSVLCDFPGQLYFFTEASLPLLTKEFSLIFNNSFGSWSFKPIDDTKYLVIDNQGRVLGKFYCVDKYGVVLHMNEKNILEIKE